MARDMVLRKTSCNAALGPIENRCFGQEAISVDKRSHDCAVAAVLTSLVLDRRPTHHDESRVRDVSKVHHERVEVNYEFDVQAEDRQSVAAIIGCGHGCQVRVDDTAFHAASDENQSLH